MTNFEWRGRVWRYPVDFSDPCFHLGMLENMPKYEAFFAAFRREAMGKIVTDVGTGTGILALLCVIAGARKVVAYERPEVAWISRLGLKAFPDLAERIELREADYMTEPALERTAVVVSETIGYLGFEEGIAGIMNKAYESTGAKIMLPRSISIELLPVRCNIHRTSSRWVSARLERHPLQTVGFKNLTGSVEFPLGGRMTPITVSTRLSIAEDAVVGGVALAISAELCDGLKVTNRGGALWPYCVLAFPRPLALSANEVVVATLRLEPHQGGFRTNLRFRSFNRPDNERCLCFNTWNLALPSLLYQNDGDREVAIADAVGRVVQNVTGHERRLSA